MGWTIEKAKVPTKKPALDTETFLAAVRAHREGRHATCKNYWSAICTVCWEQVQEGSQWNWSGKEQ